MSASSDNSKLGRRKRETFLDKTINRILMEVVGPILIIAMIGALVFFLIEIFYRGPHSARLCWVLGLFTIASVLVSRISIESGFERALMFGFALALATFIVTLKLVDFEYGNLAFLEPLVVIAFITIVMWCANRLTWDCTMIDQSRDVSSIGLTELIKRKISGKEPTPKKKPVSESAEPESAKPDSLWQKILFALFANSSTKNTPGLWVFYFAFAAFPIFGFGQWFAQPSPGWGYRWIFFLFAVYLGSGLGLLMLTSLLGLERYVNKRGVELPGVVSRTWMVVGTTFALGVMLVMLLLPSPSISNGLENALAFFTTDVKAPNKHAVGKDGHQKGENANNQKVDNNAKDAPKRDGDKGQAKGGGKDGKQSGGGKSKSNGKDKSRGKGKSDGKSDNSKGAKGQKSDSKSGEKSGEKSSQRQSDQTKGDRNDSAKSQNDARGEKSDADKSKNRENDRQQDREQQNRNAEQANKQQAKKAEQRQQQQNRADNRGQRQRAPAQNRAGNAASSIAKSLGGIVKYVVYAIGFFALLIAFWLFRDELAKFWNELFGSRKKEDDEEEPVAKKKRKEKPLPGFETFREPFSSGNAAKWKPAQTIQYTFQALEAWARGYQQPREQDVTPHEFAQQLSAVNEEVAAAALRLADMHGQSLFGEQDVVQADASQLKKIWQLMNSNAPRQSAS